MAASQGRPEIVLRRADVRSYREHGTVWLPKRRETRYFLSVLLIRLPADSTPTPRVGFFHARAQAALLARSSVMQTEAPNSRALSVERSTSSPSVPGGESWRTLVRRTQWRSTW
ncbi:hypothetical protein ACFPRL_35800 [Pseudoclavibacter helvolus]